MSAATGLRALLEAEWARSPEDLVSGLRSVPGFESRGFVATQAGVGPPYYLVLRHQNGQVWGLPCRCDEAAWGVPAWMEPCVDLSPVRVVVFAAEVAS